MGFHCYFEFLMQIWVSKILLVFTVCFPPSMPVLMLMIPLCGSLLSFLFNLYSFSLSELCLPYIGRHFFGGILSQTPFSCLIYKEIPKKIWRRIRKCIICCDFSLEAIDLEVEILKYFLKKSLIHIRYYYCHTIILWLGSLWLSLALNFIGYKLAFDG